MIAFNLLALLLLLMLLLTSMASSSAYTNGLAWCGIFFGVQILQLVFLVGRRWGPRKDRQSSFLFQLAAEGAIIFNVEGRLELRWSAFKELHVARERLFLFRSKQIAYIIPRRVFSDDAEWQSFVTAVREGFAAGKLQST